MSSDRTFLIALSISLIAHGIILWQNSNLDFFSQNKKLQKLEVSYLKNPPKTEAPKQNIVIKKEPLLKLSSKITVDKRIPPPYVDKKVSFTKPTFTKPNFIRPDIIAVKKKITLPPINMSKINSPSYISYYQIVREKIRRAAYQNYTQAEVGEVYLSFIVSKEGYLKEVRLAADKPVVNPYLRETALKSVKDAAPFPNFPPALDYPQLSFNVVISFEIE
jgi:TonB family protein